MSSSPVEGAGVHSHCSAAYRRYRRWRRKTLLRKSGRASREKRSSAAGPVHQLAAGSSERFQVYFSRMSKNNVSSDFRKTDIDEFDENKFVDEDDGGENQGGPDEAEVDGFLRQYPYMASSFFSFFFSLRSHNAGLKDRSS